MGKAIVERHASRTFSHVRLRQQRCGSFAPCALPFYLRTILSVQRPPLTPLLSHLSLVLPGKARIPFRRHWPD